MLKFLLKNFRFNHKVFFTFFMIFFAQSFAWAQTVEVQIKLTGFTDDVIADAVLNTLPATVTTNSVDAPPGNVFYAQGYSNNGTAFPDGLPLNGQFTSSTGHNFQLAPYNGNNDLRLITLQSGTLTFDVPDQREYNSLYIIATGGSNSPTVDYTINFSDATTATGTIVISDWFCNNCLSYGIKDIGRANYSNGIFESNQFAIREYPINLTTADQKKQITSIGFTVTTFGTGVANIFGITGIAPAPLPVLLNYFNAHSDNDKVMLQWETAQEFQSKQFIIERASASKPTTFVAVGNVLSNSPNGAIYNFTDVPSISGNYLYRLSQEDIDGHIKVLGIKSVTFNNKKSWVIQDMGNSWQLISSQSLQYRLIDMNGRLLKAYSGSGNVTIPKPSAHGVYQLQIETGDAIFTQKLIK